MRKLSFFTLFILLAAYIVIINILSVFWFNLPNNTSNLGTTEEGIVKIGVSDSISVSVVRNRWYGTIFEENNNSTLYIFKLIKLPLKIEGFNFVWIHIIVLIIFIFNVLKLTKKTTNKQPQLNRWPVNN